MRNRWLGVMILGALAWGQGAPGGSAVPPAQSVPPASRTPHAATGPADNSSSVPPDAAVLTIKGVCPDQPKTAAAAHAAKPAAEKQSSTCQTIVTRAEFDKIIATIPNQSPQVKKQVASALPRLIAMSEAAKKKGLDKTPQFKEMVRIQTMQILSNELTRNIQAEAAKVPPEDIEHYYNANLQSFDQFSLQRLFVPRAKQIGAGLKDEEQEKLTDEQKKEKEDAEKANAAEGEQAMTKLAEDLRARAAAGEDFIKLQKEAFEAAGMKIESPAVALPKVRRSGMPPAHASVFDLKVGEVSQVISDSGGHYIYKVMAKDQLTLDQAREEIRSKLQNDRTREMMDKLNNSFKVEQNEAYFGPAAPTTPAGPRMGAIGNPHMAPGAAPAQTQSAPPAQAPAAKQD